MPNLGLVLTRAHLTCLAHERRLSPDAFNLVADPFRVVRKLNADRGDAREESRVMNGGRGAVEGEDGDEGAEKWDGCWSKGWVLRAYGKK